MSNLGNKVKLYQSVGVVLMIGLLVEVVLLTNENRELKRSLRLNSESPADALKPGDKLAPIKVRTMDGQDSEFNYSDSSKKFLIFVLSTNCPHCEKNLVAWNSLSQQLSPDSVTIFGVSLDGLSETQEYIAVKDVRFYTASVADTSFGRKYKVSGIPETILVDGKGFLERVWIGELNANELLEIRRSVGAPAVLIN